MRKGISIIVAGLASSVSLVYGYYNQYAQPQYMAYNQPYYNQSYNNQPYYNQQYSNNNQQYYNYAQPQPQYQYPQEYYTGLPQQNPNYNPQPQQNPKVQKPQKQQSVQPQAQYQPQYNQGYQPQYNGGQQYNQGYQQQYQPQYQQQAQQQSPCQLNQQQQQQSGDDEPKKENSASTVNKITRFLTDQLSKNRDFQNITKSKMAVVSFVTAEDLGKTNKLGRMVSENLIHDLQIRGYDVLDYKTAVAIEVSSDGAFIFTSNTKKLKTKQNINYVVSGTMEYYSDGVTINARIVQLKDNKVVSTAQAFIPNDTVAEVLDTVDPYMAFHSKEKMSTVRIVRE